MPSKLTVISNYKPQERGAKCSECPLRGFTPCPPMRQELSKMTLVLDFPDRWEVANQRALAGFPGKWLRHCLKELGIGEHFVDVHHAVACQVPKGMKGKELQKARDCCRPRLERELRKSRNRHVAAVGMFMLQDWLGVKSLDFAAGTTFNHWPYRITPNYMLAKTVFKEQFAKPFFADNLLRLWREANGQPAEHRWPTILTSPNQAALEALEAMAAKPEVRVGLDVETQGIDPLRCKVMCIGLSQGDVSVCVPWDAYNSERYGHVRGLDEYPLGGRIRALVKRIAETNPTVTHNGQHDVLAMQKYGVTVNYAFDTIISHSVLAPQAHGYRGLEKVAVQEFPAIPRWKTEFHQDKEDLKGAEHFVEEQEFRLRTYCAKDTWVGEQISYAHDRRLERLHNGRKLYEMKLGQSAIAMKMRALGVRRDAKALREHSERLQERIAQHTAKMEELLRRAKFDPTGFNPGSSQHLKYLFFDHWELEPIKFSPETGEPSLDEETIKHYQVHTTGDIYDFCRNLLRFRQYSKLYNTYVKNDPASDAGYIHAEPKVYGTKTNRWSYKGPNLQTIPKPIVEIDGAGKKHLVSPGLRNILVPRPGSYWVEADYAKLELWILAVLAQDKRLLEMKEQGLDSHTENAKDLFGIKDFDPKQHKHLRDTAKTFVYNVNYGPSDYRQLAQGCWAVMRQTDKNIQLNFVYNLVLKWFKVHPEIVAYRERVFREARERGYSQDTVSGQRRVYYGYVEDTKCYNYEMQTLGAYLIGRAILGVDKEIDWEGDKLLLQVHDALHCESTKPSRLARILKKHMEAPVTIYGKEWSFPVDFKVGTSWGDAEEFHSIEDIEAWEKAQGIGD